MITEYHLEYRQQRPRSFIPTGGAREYVRKTRRFKDHEEAQRAKEDLHHERKVHGERPIEGICLDKVDIFIDHFEVEDHTITVAIIPREIGFEAGVSICIPDDQFNKRIGREKAIGRAVSNSCIQIPKKGDIRNCEEVRDILKAEMQDALESVDHPSKMEEDDIRPELSLFKRSVEKTVKDFGYKLA